MSPYIEPSPEQVLYNHSRNADSILSSDSDSDWPISNIKNTVDVYLKKQPLGVLVNLKEWGTGIEETEGVRMVRSRLDLVLGEMDVEGYHRDQEHRMRMLDKDVRDFNDRRKK